MTAQSGAPARAGDNAGNAGPKPAEDGAPPSAGDNGGTNDPGAPPRDPRLPPEGALAEMLRGYWYAEGPVGGCIGLRDYYGFEPSGAVRNLGIDHNACSGDRLLSEVTGDYALRGRELEITLPGPGSDRGPDTPPQLGDVAQRVQRMTIAIGERAATVDRPAQVYLDARAFSGNDGQVFTSVRSDVYLAADNSALYAHKLFVTLVFGLPLQTLAADRGVVVKATVQLSQSDPADPTRIQEDEITFAYDAVIREKLGWHWITALAVDGQSNEQAIAAWQEILADAGVDAHPAWARRLLEFHYYPIQRYQPGNVTVLSSSLPEYGHWTRAAQPPVVPASAP